MINFIFVNIADHEVRIPPVSPCSGKYSETVRLTLEFSPLRPQTTGRGAGCGGAASHSLPTLERAKSWKRLKPGESLTVSYKRTELFSFEEAPGVYEFWGEYLPPQLTTDEISALVHAGIDCHASRLQVPTLGSIGRNEEISCCCNIAISLIDRRGG